MARALRPLVPLQTFARVHNSFRTRADKSCLAPQIALRGARERPVASSKDGKAR